MTERAKMYTDRRSDAFSLVGMYLFFSFFVYGRTTPKSEWGVTPGAGSSVLRSEALMRRRVRLCSDRNPASGQESGERRLLEDGTAIWGTAWSDCAVRDCKVNTLLFGCVFRRPGLKRRGRGRGNLGLGIFQV